jgi:hypothetical protein
MGPIKFSLSLIFTNCLTPSQFKNLLTPLLNESVIPFVSNLKGTNFLTSFIKEFKNSLLSPI